MLLATAAAPPAAAGPTHIWYLGTSSVTTNTFSNAGEEACCTALEGRGYTVTRRQSSGVTTAPLLTDCDVVVHQDGTPGSTAIRGTVTNAAPVLALNPYYMANSAGHTALNSSATGTNASDDQIVITNTANISFTDGHAVNDVVTVMGFAGYWEALALAGASSGAFVWGRSNSGTFHYIGYGWPVGTTNLASATTVAKVATLFVFNTLQNFNADGLQIVEDIISWLTT